MAPKSNNDAEPLITDDAGEEGREWLVTYADMVTLLLTFFVMMLSLARLDTERFEQIVTSIQYSLGASVAPGGRIGRIDAHDTKRMSLSELTGRQTEPIMQDIREVTDQKNLDDVVEVIDQGDKVILRVKGQLLFNTGSSDINPQALGVLKAIADVVDRNPGWRLDVKGHTDSRPISSVKFASNWELSSLRATAVLRYLIEQGVSPGRLTATGYADTQRLVPDSSEENMARNRRVEFVLEKQKGQ